MRLVKPNQFLSNRIFFTVIYILRLYILNNWRKLISAASKSSMCAEACNDRHLILDTGRGTGSFIFYRILLIYFNHEVSIPRILSQQKTRIKKLDAMSCTSAHLGCMMHKFLSYKKTKTIPFISFHVEKICFYLLFSL